MESNNVVGSTIRVKQANSNKIRVSNAKYRNSVGEQFGKSSSIIKQKIPKQLRTNSKLQMIKSKCMPIIATKRFFNEEKIVNDSVDIETLSEKNHQEVQTKAYILKSAYPDRPPTLFFKYPRCCGIVQTPNNKVVAIQKPQLFYKLHGSEYRCVINPLQQNGFKRVSDEDDIEWNIMMDMSGVHLKQISTMNRYQKINHFSGCWNLGRKDHMWRHLNKQRRIHPQAYNFTPATYLFPSDFDRFDTIRQNADKNKLWIMKPSNQACGRGIKIISKQSHIQNKKDFLVSEYIDNPHLINGYKYDLRIYVVVTSYDPLRIYMFKEGLTRFATYSYTTNIKDIKKKFIHLTNFSINKHSSKFVNNSKAQQDGEGSKWSLTALRKYYQNNGINHQRLFQQIKSIVIKTCISAQPVMMDIKTQQKRTCGFQLYGFDILVDSNYKPWLMEVNVCPSLHSSSPMDRRIKHTLLTDTYNLIGLQQPTKNTIASKAKLYNHDKKFYSKHISNLQQLNYSNCIQVLTPDDWLVLFESEEQMHRLGHFERIFPNADNIPQMKHLFEFNRYNNLMLWKNITSQKNFLERVYQ